MTAVSDLLEASLRIHKAALPGKGQRRDFQRAKEAWTIARQKRVDALAADPDKTDPAWEAEPVKHDAMMAFYADVIARVKAHRAGQHG